MPRRAALVVALALLAAAAHGGPPAAPRPLRGLRAEVAALLMQGVDGGALPVAAALFPRPAASGTAPIELPFLVEVAAGEPLGSGGEAALELYVYAVDAGGEVAGHRAIELPRPRAAGEGSKLAGRLALAPGSYSLRFLVFDPASRRYGMAVRDIELAATSDAPRLAEECADWSVIGDAVDELDGVSARPVLVTGERRRLTLAPGARLGAPGWRVRLSAAGGEAAVTDATPTTADDGLVFEVPELPAGPYRLTVEPPGGARGDGPRALEIWLVPDLPSADGVCRRSWGRVLRLALGGDSAPATPATPVDRPTRTDRRLAEDYRQVLARLAGGAELAAAGGHLAELEASLVEHDPGKLKLLFSTELAAARRLAERDARCLIPLVALHGDAYVAHYGAGRFALATHSRRMAAAIAELAAGRLTAAEELTLVASSITGLADRVERRRASLEAQRLLVWALALDPEQEAARLLLAVSYERRGRYEDARRQLESLVAANSAHHEGRVRLAILLRRMGQLAAAERLLLEVVAERPPEWLLSLAYQTLAQLLGRQGRFAEAVAELDRARRQLPGDQAVGLMLAYALDRDGQRQEALAQLLELPPARAGRTARYRYSDEPAAALGLLHDTVRQSVAVRLPLLGRALADGVAAGPAP